MTTAGQQIAGQANSNKNKDVFGSIIYNVKAFGAKGDGVTDDTSKISSAITDASATGGIVFLPPGTYLTGNQTVPYNVTLWFANGAILSINSGSIVTINGPIDAGVQQIFTGSGTVSGNIQVDFVYPQWFGAKGDGVTNDASAVQKSINTGKPVYLAQGTFFLGSTGLTGVKSLFGAGKSLTSITYNGATTTGLSVTSDKWVIRDLTITHTGTATSGAIINIDAGNYGILENVMIANGATAVSIANSQSVKIRGIELWGFTTRGLYFNTANNDIFVSDTFINGQTPVGAAGTGTGILLQNKAEAITFDSVEVILCSYPLYTDATSYVAGSRPAFCRFSNCYFDSCTNGANVSKVVEFKFTQCLFANRPGNGCLVDTVDGVVFTSCEFVYCGQHGCLVTSNAKRTKWIGCEFISNSSQGANTYHGLTIGAGATDFVVQGCTASNSIPFVGFSGTQGWGILLGGGASDRYIIADNLISGNGTGGVSDGGSGVNKRVANNY